MSTNPPQNNEEYKKKKKKLDPALSLPPPQPGLPGGQIQ